MRVAIIGGGTFSHVRNHLSLCAPAFGNTAKQLAQRDWGMPVDLYLTKMANPSSSLETSQDVAGLLDKLVADPETRCIVFNCALVDYDGQIGQLPSGKHAERLKTREGEQSMRLSPADKLIGRIRKTRKDIFVIGFKTTTGASEGGQYQAGLKLLKQNSLNLVLANDTVARTNLVIVPEEAIYRGHTREHALDVLADMAKHRMRNTFTRSTVVEGEAVPWQSELIPNNLRQVVDFCRKEGAYKPVLGKTAGHFAVKVSDSTILTSIRKTDFNELDRIGLVKIESTGPDNVIAHGFKPSVGGQSQRIIFSEHPEMDCIVHFHSPVKAGSQVNTASQWENECGSHQCGKNTSDHLSLVEDGIKAVYLDEHGPNVVFNRHTPADRVISFIQRNFDLTAKTGGMAVVGMQ